MNNLRELKKLARKEGKKNPEHIYNLGQYYYSIKDYSYKNYYKWRELNEKAAKLGCPLAELEEAKYYIKEFKENPNNIVNGSDLTDYYKRLAISYLSSAAGKGNEEAKKLLLEFNEESKDYKKKVIKALYEKVLASDDEWTKFQKLHTLVVCPVCRGKIKNTNTKTTGSMSSDYIKVYDKGTMFEKRSDPFSDNSKTGQSNIKTYVCQNPSCKFSFTKIDNIIYTRKQGRNVYYGADTPVGKYDTYLNQTITYKSNTAGASAQTLKILRDSEGKRQVKL